MSREKLLFIRGVQCRTKVLSGAGTMGRRQWWSGKLYD